VVGGGLLRFGPARDGEIEVLCDQRHVDRAAGHRPGPDADGDVGKRADDIADRPDPWVAGLPGGVHVDKAAHRVAGTPETEIVEEPVVWTWSGGDEHRVQLEQATVGQAHARQSVAVADDLGDRHIDQFDAPGP
jgi:hypothetical protein